MHPQARVEKKHRQKKCRAPGVHGWVRHINSYKQATTMSAATITTSVVGTLASAIGRNEDPDDPLQDLRDGHVFHDPDNADDPYPFCPVCSSLSQWSDGCDYTLADYIGLDRSG
jgi:hypothetical protein